MPDKLIIKFNINTNIPQTLRLSQEAMTEIVKLHNRTHLSYNELASQMILFASSRVEIEYPKE